MMIKRLLNVSVLLLLTLSVLSCTSGSKAEKAEALNAVKAYNSMLKRAYMEANNALMVGVATEKQMKMLFPTIQALRATGNSMMTEQKTFTVKKVSVKDNSAQVKTVETWVFWWQDKDSAAITKPEETITYKIQYNLVKENGFWKVDKLEDAE